MNEELGGIRPRNFEVELGKELVLLSWLMRSFPKTEAAPVSTCKLWGDSGLIEREEDRDVLGLRRDFVTNRWGPWPSLHVRLGEFRFSYTSSGSSVFSSSSVLLAQFPEKFGIFWVSDESCSEGCSKVFPHCYCEWEVQRQGTLLQAWCLNLRTISWISLILHFNFFSFLCRCTIL